MKKRICSLLLALLMVGSSVCSAAEPIRRSPNASLYLDAYSVSVNPKGGGLMSVTFVVYGTGTMDVIGAEKIVVEEWDGSDWEETGTFTAENNSNFLYEDASEYTSSVTFYGTPGVQYRATVTAYAEKDGGSDTGTHTSTPKTCK